jgi:hypothetical protein
VNLARLLPDAPTADLLVAMLRGGPPAVDACPRALLPLLYDMVRRNGLPLDPETVTYLRSAYVTESLRSRAYAAIVDELAALLSGAPFLLLKGAAVGPLYYADPALRHAHDIEILVGTSSRAALAGSRFRPVGRHYVHASGLPLRVYTRLFVPRFSFDERSLWQSAIAMPNGLRTVSAADALALTLVHASRSVSRLSGRWACDAHAIVRHGDVDWSRFLHTVTTTGAALAVTAQLHWLRDTLDLPVPTDVLAALDTHRAGPIERFVIARGLAIADSSRPNRLWRRVLR